MQHLIGRRDLLKLGAITTVGRVLARHWVRRLPPRPASDPASPLA